MEKVAGTTELEAAGTVYETAESVQEATAFLPDYAFPESESAIGTTVSGIVGALLVVVLCVGISYLFRFFRNKRAKAAA